MFNCTSYGIPIRWSVFTPNINYTNLEISAIDSQVHSESMDGVIMADRIALNLSTMPITIVSSLTVNVRVEHDESKVQCIGLAANKSASNKSGFIHITGDHYFLIRHIKRCSPLQKYSEE